MKRAALCVFSVAVFLFAAAPTAVERKVFINDKPFADGILIGGKLFIPLEHLARSVGATTTLEPFFKLEGTKLHALGRRGENLDKAPALTQMKAVAPIDLKIIGPVDHKVVAPADHKIVSPADYKLSPIEMKHKMVGSQALQIKRGGEVSSKIEFVEGKAYVPVQDVIKALGASYVVAPSDLQAGAPLRLSVRSLCDGCVLVLK